MRDVVAVSQVGSFPLEIPDFFPDEQAAVGTECVDMAQRMMQSVAETVRILADWGCNEVHNGRR